MATLILGLIVFFAPHLFTALARGARGKIVKAIGIGPYKGTFSLISIIGFALIIWGWRQADVTVVYVSPYWLTYVTQALMLVALILLVSAYSPKGRLAAAVKHPMLAAVKLWAFGHLLVNGDVRSLILFGSFLAYAVIDRIAVKRRGAPVPAAGPIVRDAFPIVLGAAAWAAIYFYLHQYIAGVALR
ncbi:MAG: NnrU family protein [Amphiplicatus sp.]